jgi:anaerobic magnesium-protoporphyrin IX monomethyl ester cyclase
VLEGLSGRAVCLGVSAMTGGQLARALEITEHFRGRLPVVWGGQHPSLLPEQCLTESGADFVAVGDGEPFIGPFLRHLAGDLPPQSVPGLAWQDTAGVHINASSRVQSMDAGVYPQEAILDLEPYVLGRDCFARCLPLETSRGCPHACGFCHNAATRSPWRPASAAAVANAARSLAGRHRLDGIIFQEDSFFVSRPRAEEICGLLQGASFRWKANCRVAYIAAWGSPFLSRLEAGRCAMLQLGIESGAARTLERIAKGHTVERAIEANRLLADTGILVRYNFVVGFPWETAADIEATVSLSERLRAENQRVVDVFFNIYVPYPSTPLYQELEAAGYAVPRSLQEWAGATWNNAGSPWLDAEARDLTAALSQGHFDRSRYFRGPDACAGS